MAPQRVKLDELGTALEPWEDMVCRYNKKNARLGQAELPNDIRCSALESTVPEELEKHLQLNAARLVKYDDMRVEVLTFFEASTGKQLRVNVRSQMPSQQTHTPMEVDALVNSLMKGGGKGGGKGKPTEGCKGDITCHNCGKKGHKQAECWSKPKAPTCWSISDDQHLMETAICVVRRATKRQNVPTTRDRSRLTTEKRERER